MVYRAYWSLVTFLGHSEDASIVRDGHRCDALGAFDARVSFLGGVLEMVHNYVVPGGVDHLIVVQEEDVISDIGFEAGYKLGLKSDGRIVTSLSSRLSTGTLTPSLL